MTTRPLPPQRQKVMDARKYLAALRALDRIMDFANPDQLYVFNPTDEPVVQRAWKQAATALALAKNMRAPR